MAKTVPARGVLKVAAVAAAAGVEVEQEGGASSAAAAVAWREAMLKER